MGNSPTKTKDADTKRATSPGRKTSAGDRAQSPTRNPHGPPAKRPAPTSPRQQAGAQTQSRGVPHGGNYGAQASDDGSDMFMYRQASEYAGQTPVSQDTPSMPPPATTPAPHPSLNQLPQAMSAAPEKRGESHQPVRLTSDAIAATAYNWQRPPIGKGGFSTVYEGTFYGHSVAVKVLTIRNPSERQMFEEELQALLNPSLMHRNICPLLAFCYEAPAFIFPKLSPLSLERLKRLPLDVRDSVCIDVARGLAHMHAAGYVHSDMKPDNVLIEFDENRVIRRAMVGDMGCVKSCAVPVAPFGTIVFLDPGLPHGVQRLPHPADDVYSLGVTFLCIFMEAIPASVDDICRMDYDFAQRDPLRSGLVRSMMNPDAARRPTCAYIAHAMRQKQEEMWRAAAGRAATSPVPQGHPAHYPSPVSSQASAPPTPAGPPQQPQAYQQAYQQPPPQQPYQQQQPMDYRQRLMNFYQHYAPEKASNVDSILQAYRGKEEKIFADLESKYGPEPHKLGQQPHHQQQQPPMDYRQRLLNFYQHYDPSKAGNVDAVLKAYHGKEEKLFASLEAKYGPEPHKLQRELPRQSSTKV
uniref:Protein kinase domain-containing protein n=1 Tax=Neobodo designis TaxID=312471 RepID=A0A7S1QX02_NEODS|mmetsp:Transcript_53644/g.164970  ORF Transcript_53644/g.164970 Transcript_53644/m.164970 type:complete len:581 (+) Transcript_53644:32-1774(+)